MAEELSSVLGRNGAEKTVSSATEFAVSFITWNCHWEKVTQPKNTIPRHMSCDLMLSNGK